MRWRHSAGDRARIVRELDLIDRLVLGGAGANSRTVARLELAVLDQLACDVAATSGCAIWATTVRDQVAMAVNLPGQGCGAEAEPRPVATQPQNTLNTLGLCRASSERGWS